MKESKDSVFPSPMSSARMPPRNSGGGFVNVSLVTLLT
jgi:hypothetical protein